MFSYFFILFVFSLVHSVKIKKKLKKKINLGQHKLSTIDYITLTGSLKLWS